MSPFPRTLVLSVPTNDLLLPMVKQKKSPVARQPDTQQAAKPPKKDIDHRISKVKEFTGLQFPDQVAIVVGWWKSGCVIAGYRRRTEGKEL